MNASQALRPWGTSISNKLDTFHPLYNYSVRGARMSETAFVEVELRKDEQKETKPFFRRMLQKIRETYVSFRFLFI